MSERAVEYLLKKLNVTRDEAIRYVSQEFASLDLTSRIQGHKPPSEEEKANVVIGIVKAADLIGEAIKKALDNS